jgi:hypothetical protein
MKYFRLAIVAALFIGLIFWLHQCTAGDSADASANLGLTPAQIDALKHGQTDGLPASLAPAPTPKPATGS